jgi:hypothetical protein
MFYGSSRLAAAWLAAAFALPAVAEEADKLDIHAGDYTAASSVVHSSFVPGVGMVDQGEVRPVVAEAKED